MSRQSSARGAPLRHAIEIALGSDGLTYHEITNLINDQRLYIPKDGLLVVEQQVRTCVRENARLFDTDKGSMLIGLERETE